MLQTMGQGAVLDAIAKCGFTNVRDDYLSADFEKTDSCGNKLVVKVSWHLRDPEEPDPNEYANACLVRADDGYHYWLYPANSHVAKVVKQQRIEKVLQNLPPLVHELAVALKDAKAIIQALYAYEQFPGHAHFLRVDKWQSVHGQRATGVHVWITYMPTMMQPSSCDSPKLEQPEPEPLPTWVYFFPTIVAVSVIAAVAILMALML